MQVTHMGLKKKPNESRGNNPGCPDDRPLGTDPQFILICDYETFQ